MEKEMRIVHHVCFEIEYMLNQLFLHDQKIGKENGYVMSGLCDAIQMHIRNLIEFFFRGGGPSDTFFVHQIRTCEDWATQFLKSKDITDSWEKGIWKERWKEYSRKTGHLCDGRSENAKDNIREFVTVVEELLPFIEEFLRRVEEIHPTNPHFINANIAVREFSKRRNELKHRAVEHVMRLKDK